MIKIENCDRKRILASVRALHWFDERLNRWSTHGSGVIIIRNDKLYLICTLHSLLVTGKLYNPDDTSLNRLKVSVCGLNDRNCAKFKTASWMTILPEMSEYDENKDFIIYELDREDPINSFMLNSSGCFSCLPKVQMEQIPCGSSFILCGYTKDVDENEDTKLIPKILPCKMESFDNQYFKCKVDQAETVELDGCSGGGIFAFNHEQIPVLVGLIQQASNNIVRGLSFPYIREMIDNASSTPPIS